MSQPARSAAARSSPATRAASSPLRRCQPRPINEVAVLVPGQSRQTGVFTAPGSYGFHDHGNPTDASLQGIIVIR